jgi:16S rRNA (guanine527-N7)-methyltransferase
MSPRLLRDGLAGLSIPASERQLSRLTAYIEELELWNRRMNLVKATGDGLIIRHILDCLAGLPLIQDLSPATIVDVGTGAGLPGVLLSLFLPDTGVTLLDRSTKRAAFLKNVVAIIEAANCRIVEKDISEEAGRYDLVCTRAFLPLDQAFELLAPRLNPGGTLFFYKGKKSVIIEELDRMDDKKSGLDQAILPVTVPFLDEERHILRFRDTNR